MTYIRSKKQVEDMCGAAYKRGFEDGRDKRDRTMLLLATTNRCLFDEIIRLDNDEGAGKVHLSVTAAKGILGVLRQVGDYGRSKPLAAKINALEAEREKLALTHIVV